MHASDFVEVMVIYLCMANQITADFQCVPAVMVHIVPRTPDWGGDDSTSSLVMVKATG